MYCDGECPEDKKTLGGRFSSLPYNPLGESDGNSLIQNTTLLDAKTYAENENYTDAAYMYNHHGQYGTRQLELTSYYLEMDSSAPNPHQRKLVLSRSTFAGAGAYGGHWLGDNGSSFEDMKNSIAGILNFQMFGVPFTGANICGSTGDVNQEVCARWYQLGAFYPFARSYFKGNFGTKEPWALTGDYQKAARNALKLRLSLLRYFYTIFFEINQNGGSFWRPLFFEFSKDDGAMKDIEHTFMIGKYIKVTPVTKSVAAGGKIESYFPPNTRFLDLITWTDIIDGGSKGAMIQLTPNWDFPLVHLREGSIVPYQPYDIANRTTELVTQKAINLLIFPDKERNAEGTVYTDFDGLDRYQLENNLYQHYKLTYSNRALRIVLVDGYDAGGRLDMNQIISNITIVDAGEYNDTDFACMFNENMEPSKLSYTYDSATRRLHLYAKDETQVTDLRNMKNIQFGNTKTDQNFCDVKYQVSNVEIVQEGSLAGKQVVISAEATGFNMIGFNAIITLIKDDLVNVEIIPEVTPPVFSIPDVVLNKTLYPITNSYSKNSVVSYVNLPKTGDNFFFEIHVFNEPSQVLFSTKNQPFTYTTYYKQMGAKLYGNNRIFGFGERIGNFWAEVGTYSIWNRDGPHVFEDGEPPGKNLYGSHPVYFMQRSKNTEFFGVYDHNSGPQDFVIEHTKDGIEMNNIKTTGKTNLFFMMNADINKVIQNYYDLVGKPNLPPEWGFGWHQSRFGYNSTNYLRDVYKGYQNKSLPLDALWSDVDLLEAFRVFTLDKVNFGDIKDVVSEMKTTGTHYVTLIGSGISAGVTDAYFEGKKKGVFLKSPNKEKDTLIGRNTPGDVVFVDFFYHNSREYWLNQLETFRKDVPFDGVWLDMNEITSYCDGVCYIDQKAENPIDNKLFYWPGGRDLEKNTISLDAVHENGGLELSAHSLFGILQSYETAEYFKSKNQRPFIISRSTFAGSGKYAGHWTGDNKSDFKDLMNSVNSVLLFNMFGIPFVGADVCGYHLTASATLCAQWYKLAVVYPFARNHNELMSHGQEPYNDNMFGFVIDSRYNFTAQQIMKKAMMIRYGLHRYSYTQYHKASTEGIPPLKPLFFNYPNDQYSYEYVTENFFLGDGVKVSPHITFYGRSQFYFPGSSDQRWCPIWE